MGVGYDTVNQIMARRALHIPAGGAGGRQGADQRGRGRARHAGRPDRTQPDAGRRRRRHLRAALIELAGADVRSWFLRHAGHVRDDGRGVAGAAGRPDGGDGDDREHRTSSCPPCSSSCRDHGDQSGLQAALGIHYHAEHAGSAVSRRTRSALHLQRVGVTAIMDRSFLRLRNTTPRGGKCARPKPNWIVVDDNEGQAARVLNPADLAAFLRRPRRRRRT